MKIANLGKRTFKILTKIKRETYQNLKCKRVQNLNSGVGCDVTGINHS